MTIQDILNNGIEMQGNIKVTKWDKKKEVYKVLAKTDIAIFKPEVLNREITYMYADGTGLVIEVE